MHTEAVLNAPLRQEGKWDVIKIVHSGTMIIMEMTAFRATIHVYHARQEQERLIVMHARLHLKM